MSGFIDKIGLRPSTRPKMGKTSAEERLTLMIVSSRGRTHAVGFNTSTLRMLAWAGFVVALAATIFITSYRMLGHELADLRYLDDVAESQKQQIQDLQSQYTTLHERLMEAEAVESKIKDMLGNEGLLPQSYLASGDDSPFVRTSFPQVSRDGSDVTRLSSNADIGRALFALQTKAASLDESTAIIAERAKALLEVSAEIVAKTRATPMGKPATGPISSDYGWRTNPFGSSKEHHQAVDIAAGMGEPIVATADGVVTFSGYKSGYGYTIIVKHSYGFETLYAHCSRLKATNGKKVVRGEVIAYVGQSGSATGPHVHYEVHVNGEKVDPKDYFSSQTREVDHSVR